MRVLRVSHSAVVSAWRARERALIARGVEVRLVSARSWNEGGALVHLEPDGDDFVAGAATVGSHPVAFVFDPRPLWRELRDGRWDLIDIHEEPCSLATAEVRLLRRMAGVRAPFVLYSAQNIPKRFPPPFRWFERAALRGAAGVSVCNAGAGRILRRKGLRGAVAEIPLGVDLADGPPVEQGDRSGSGPLRIGYAGRLERHKGVHVVIDALALVPDAQLVVVGSGPERAALQAQADASGVAGRVEFRGSVAAEAMPTVYGEFDVLVVPSLPTPGWLEQFGRVAVEAMACGVPVVASDSGALPEVVGAAGVLVRPGDVRAWARALNELAEDPSRRQVLAAAGRARVRRYTWDAVADGMLALYAQATGAAPADPAPRSAVEVVVVAYGAPDKLAAALAPLAGQFPVIVVDNSSSAATREVVERAGARYLDPGTNLGFAAAVNLGCAAREDPEADVLLLNPDAIVTAADVQRLREALAADPGLAAVAPEIVDADGAAARALWPFPTPARAVAEAAGLGRLPTRGGFLIGAVLLLRAQAVAELGGLDERFFLYAEETDWQLRARRLGWRLGLVSQARAMHEGAGAGGDPTWREAQFTASLELYIRKHYGAAGWAVFRAANLLGAAARGAVLRGPARDAARRRVALYLRGPVRVSARLPRPGTGVPPAAAS